MNRKRLLQLRTAFAAWKPSYDEAFDMNVWYRTKLAFVPHQGSGVPEPVCQTAVCLGGFAATIFDFSSRGLSLIASEGPAGDLILHYDGLFGLPALERFFDLNEAEAEMLFLPSRYTDNMGREITQEDVLKRLDRLLKTAEEEVAT